MTFASLGAHPALQRALTEKGYAQPTPVQAAVLAPELAGLDLLVSAETGSGKTVAFGLAFAPTLLGEETAFGPTRKPLALVIAPTRELALQVQSELWWLYQPARGRVAACVGGMDIRRELRSLNDGAHIVVGTPGRLVDHLERGSLVLDGLRALVLDEADEMLDMGFRDELEHILKAAPKERRTLLFSATIPPPIVQLAERYQRSAKRIAATPPQQAHRDIEYRAHVIAPKEREHAVVNVLRAYDASAIVFCQTRDAVNHLQANLVERGFAAVAISGELTQPERTRALKALRDGRARVLVATDVAARGLDLPDVGLVIHADLPHDASGLQHRSGRTGRAGKKGISVVLVPAPKRRWAEKLLREARTNARWEEVPSAEAIRALDQQRVLKDITAFAGEITEEDLAVARLLLAERTPEQLAGMLSVLHRAKLPAAEEVAASVSLAKAPLSVPRARPASGPSHAPTRASSHAASSEPHAPTRAPSHAASSPARPRPAHTQPTGATTWFTINVGRSANADPRWLIPLLCRRGEVTKADIGAIKIFAEETRVEIVSSAAERFADAARKPDRQDPRIRIAPASAATKAPAPARPHTAARPPRSRS